MRERLGESHGEYSAGFTLEVSIISSGNFLFTGGGLKGEKLEDNPSHTCAEPGMDQLSLQSQKGSSLQAEEIGWGDV